MTERQLHVDAMLSSRIETGCSSSSDTLGGSGRDTPVDKSGEERDTLSKEKKQTKRNYQRDGRQREQKKPKSKSNSKPKTEMPLYEQLGDELLRSTRLHLEPVNQPLPQMPPVPNDLPILKIPESNETGYFSNAKLGIFLPKTRSAASLALPRKSVESGFSNITKIIQDAEDSSVQYRAKGAVYSLHELSSISAAEDLILRYGRVAHMGVRDSSYRFWMNSTRSAAVHFKVLSKVAVLGGDPLCHPDRLALTLKEFSSYCRKAGWKTAIVGASSNMANIAKQHRWTCMNFGTEKVVNPQTNEVLLGKSGKRITTQCRQLLDPLRGGIKIHTYNPIYGRDAALESLLCKVYDDWRDERNASSDTQAFVTVFDLFAMHNLMTYLYTTDESGEINGFAALRKLYAGDGYHIDPFIQTSSASRGVSDLLIFASLALLRAQGCSYLSLGYEPVSELKEIWGLPSMLHSTTKRVYKHVFGKIPVGGKEAFHTKWKPDKTRESSLYLIFVGKIPSPRYMLAMTHFANISFRRIVAHDWQELVTNNTKSAVSGSAAEGESLDGETSTQRGAEIQGQQYEPLHPRPKTATYQVPRIIVKDADIVRPFTSGGP